MAAGQQAAQVVWRASAGDKDKPPCAPCMAMSNLEAVQSHTPTRCFVGLCCSCLKVSKAGASGTAFSAVADL